MQEEKNIDSEKNDTVKENGLEGIIDAEQGALILIDILYEQGHISNTIYGNIKNKYENGRKKEYKNETDII